MSTSVVSCRLPRIVVNISYSRFGLESTLLFQFSLTASYFLSNDALIWFLAHRARKYSHHQRISNSRRISALGTAAFFSLTSADGLKGQGPQKFSIVAVDTLAAVPSRGPAAASPVPTVACPVCYGITKGPLLPPSHSGSPRQG